MGPGFESQRDHKIVKSVNSEYKSSMFTLFCFNYLLIEMIQRIQSLLLLGVVVLLTANLFVPIWSSGQVVLNAVSITQAGNTPEAIPVKKEVYYIAALIVVCILLATYTIFIYKKRVTQMRLCNLLTLLTLGIIGCYFLAISAAKALINEATDGTYEIGYFLPIIASILVLAARYFIRKDDQLVRSVDRIR